MHYLITLAEIVSIYALLAYLLFILGILFEGEFILITSGILAHIGVLPVGVTIIIAVLAGLLKSILGYELGVGFARRFPRSVILKYAEHKVLSFLPKFKEQPFWSIFISKFIYGINHLSILFAGYIRANFKTFFLAESLSTLFWAPGFFLLGYFFSYTAFSFTHDIKKVLLLILAFVIIFVLLQKLLTLIITFFEEYNT